MKTLIILLSLLTTTLVHADDGKVGYVYLGVCAPPPGDGVWQNSAFDLQEGETCSTTVNKAVKALRGLKVRTYWPAAGGGKFAPEMARLRAGQKVTLLEVRAMYRTDDPKDPAPRHWWGKVQL